MYGPGLRAVSTITGAGERTVRLSGEIDIAVIAELDSVLETSIGESGTTCVVIDLTDLEFIDAGGARSLLKASRQGALTGVAVRIRGSRGHVDTVLTLLGVIEPRPPAHPDTVYRRADRR